MKIQESAEMYLENILVLREKKRKVRSIDIVELTGYSKPSISRAVSLLREQKLILVDSNGYITLTASGEEIAQRVYERHKLLTQFFEHIGVSHDTAVADACRFEHIISDETFEKMKEHADGQYYHDK